MQRKPIGLILAGGKAQRFGGGKALATLRGKPLVFWVKEALKKVCEEVWLSLRSLSQPEASLQKHFTRTVLDILPGAGPLSGLLAALKDLDPHRYLLVASCDQPLLSPALLKNLEARFKKGNFWAAFLLNPQGLPEPFPGIYTPSLVPSLEQFLSGGQKSVRKWLKGLPPHRILGLPSEIWYLWDPGGLSLANVNYQEDLEKLKKFFLYEKASHSLCRR